MQGPPPMPPLFGWLERGRGVLAPASAIVGSLGLLLVLATVFLLGAPSDPCAPDSKTCGPDQIASSLGAVAALVGICLVAIALWTRRLRMPIRLATVAFATVLTIAGWVHFVASF